MIFNGSIALGAWTKSLGFELDPDHNPDPGTGLTPDFWILAGYLKKLWTDFDEILCVNSCGGLHDLVMFWAGSESGSWIRTCIQNCKADIAKSNERISMKFYEWIACESRKTAFNFGSDTRHIQDAVSISRFYPDYWLQRFLTNIGAEMAPTTGKSWGRGYGYAIGSVCLSGLCINLHEPHFANHFWYFFVTAFRRSMSNSKANFVDISQFIAKV